MEQIKISYNIHKYDNEILKVSTPTQRMCSPT